MKTGRSPGLILALLFLLTTYSGCGTSTNLSSGSKTEFKTIDKPGIISEDKLYSASDAAGLQLLRKICAENEGENAIFSPISLSVMLAVLENGASGRTREEIDAIINPEKLSTGQLNDKYCNIINHLNNAGYEENGSKTTRIEVANSLWIQKQFPVKDTFLKAANTYFNADTYNIDFSKEDAISAMNRWIEEKTHGRIKDYADEFNPMTSMVAFNALYFNGKWQSPFDKSKTQKDDFHLKDGSTARVDMMNAEKRIDYYAETFSG